MSSSHTVYGIIGLKVKLSKLQVEVEERICDCNVSLDTEPKYCPSCGKKFKQKRWEYIEGINENSDLKFNSYVSLLGKYPVVDSFSDPVEDSDAFIVIEEISVYKNYSYDGYYDDDFSGDPPTEFSKLNPDALIRSKQKMKDSLTPLGLWDEEKFGLWSVLQS